MKLRTRISSVIAILALIFGVSLGTLLQKESEALAVDIMEKLLDFIGLWIALGLY